jgi:hypothetical protein
MFAEAGRDTIVAWDQSSRRLSWFTMGGSLIHERTLRGDHTASGADLSGEFEDISENGTFLLLADKLRSLYSKPGKGFRDLILTPQLIHDSGSAIALLPPVTMMQYSVSVNANGEGGGSGNWFQIRRLLRLGIGPFPLSIADRFVRQIDQYDTTGRLRRIIRASIPRTPFPSSMRNWPTKDFPAPDSLPAIQMMWIDPAGRIWVGQATEDPPPYNLSARSPSSFEVFDPDGLWLGSVELPRNLGKLEDIGTDYLLFVAHDTNDITTLRTHRIRRPA